jgi:hypothetical protein
MATDYVKLYKSLIPASHERRSLRLIAGPGFDAAVQDAARRPAPAINGS